jgi:hypothetical protein
MLATLPLLGFALLWLLSARGNPDEEGRRVVEWRDAFGMAAVAWGWMVVGITLLLSLFRGLTQVWLSACWFGVDGLLVVALIRRVRRGDLGRVRHRLRADGLRGFDRGDGLILASIALLLVLIAIVAFFAGPTDSDAIGYHLPRAIHWAQDQSVAPFATPNSRQFYSPPWAEYVILQFMVLLRSDRLSNLVQWFGLVGALILTSRIASLLGVDRRGQLVTAVFAATLPPLIYQGSSSLNDGVAAFWVVCVCWIVVSTCRRQSSWQDWRLLGGVLAMAALTKATSLVYSLPLVLWFAWREARRLSVRLYVLRGVAAVGIALAGALVIWLPSWLLLGSPFGSSEHIAGIANQAIGVRWMLSNAIRSLALLAATPIDRVNSGLYSLVVWLHKPLGLSVSEPAITYGQGGFGGIGWLWPGEASAPLHLLLSGIAILWVLVRARQGPDSGKKALAVSAVGGFVLFCLLFQLQWPARFHLSFFLLAAPLAAAWLGHRPVQRLTPWVILALVIAALPVVTMDRWRPMFRVRPLVWNQSVVIRPREEMYFLLGPDYTAAKRAAAAIDEARCNRVALILDSDDSEYPWWVLFGSLEGRVRLEHLLVFPAFDAFRDPGFMPCAVVCSVCDANWDAPAGMQGSELGPGVWMYLPDGDQS